MLQKDLERFCEKFVVTEDENDLDSCWLWVAGIVENGYARFYLDGKSRSAHRVIYEHFYGEIEYGYDVHHKCHNRSCVNPQHLAAVTRSENGKASAHLHTLTHCKRGHELSDENVFYAKRRNGTKARRCKQCASIYFKSRKSSIIRLVDNMTIEDAEAFTAWYVRRNS